MVFERLRAGAMAAALAALGWGCAGPVGPEEEVGASVEAVVAPGLIKQVRADALAAGVTPLDPPVRPSRELLILGRDLAFDKILSGNRDISCMTCHHPTLGLTDGRSLSVGQGAVGLGPDRVHPDGAFIPRNAPPLSNLHAMDAMFWDGRVEETPEGLVTPAGAQITPAMEAIFQHGAVSAQAMFPVLSREEMRGQPGENELADIPDADMQGIWAALMARLGAIPEYVTKFEAAYPGERFEDMTFAHAANAIAAWEVGVFAFVDTPVDRFLAGDDEALTLRQLKGLNWFLNQGGCVDCHSGPALTDLEHHATAMPQIGPGAGHGPTGTDDHGRAAVTGDPPDLYAFRTPPLRNVALTGPWGHAGQFATLEALMGHFVDPEASLAGYDPTQLEAALQTTLQPTQTELLGALDPAMAPPTLDLDKAAELTALMAALTDEAAREARVPETVPSGLPVSDDPPVPNEPVVDAPPAELPGEDIVLPPGDPVDPLI